MEIAKQLNMSIKTVQKIAFTLILIGCAEENFLLPTLSNSLNHSQFIPIEELMTTTPNKPEKPTISCSFLTTLVSFLRKKAY